MLSLFANMASLMALMATIPATAAQPTTERADSLTAQTAPNAAAPRWALSVFAQPPGRAVCALSAVLGVDSGEKGSACKRFPSGPKSFHFNGDGKFRLTVCPGGVDDICGDDYCVTQESTGVLPCTRMSGFEYYQVK